MLLTAPAKVNLYLHIVGKRGDGYHLLESLVAFTDICDTVEIHPAESLSLTVRGPYARALETGNNIVLKAAEALASLAGIPPNVHITLHKEIPLGAGLGGGSADAAATIKLLMALWNLTLDGKTLLALALELGADVPVMLHGKAALMSGIGEMIQPIALPFALPAVLVNPGVFLSTAAVFKQGSARVSKKEVDALHHFESLAETDICPFLAQKRNDLEPPAIALQPVIGEVLAMLSAQDGALFSRMSGSGATCFAVFPEEAAASRAWQNISTSQPDWWVRKTWLR